jgi:glycosyltransferase involved in cell wall biosynthesis
MRVLALTNLFPNQREPNRGCFNLQQFAALRRHAEVRVIAPIAWQPWNHGLSRPAPYQETWSDIPTLHPFYFYTPGIGRAAYALWMYCSLRGVMARVVRSYRPDVLLGTWAYPDAVAAAALARRWELPWLAKVHGSDIHVLAKAPLPRQQIRWALRQASRTFAVSTGLKQQLVELGVPAERIQVQHNGVDVERFQLQEKTAARIRTGLPLERRVVVYVGNLKASKGVLDLLEAARQLTAAPAGSEQGKREAAPLIVFVGGGDARDRLAEEIGRQGLANHVRLVGAQPHGEISTWIAAADALCLPSHQEGCPNVVLEALACGRPVVACCVGAVPDLIDAACGALVPPREPEQLAAALREVVLRPWDAAALRQRVLPFSWEDNARVLAAGLADAARQRGRLPAVTDSPAALAGMHSQE